jgi:chromosome partitioning protein
MTHIIAVANEKGGVAKTTTTLSLGGSMVESGKDVLLIDLDAQANLTLALGIKPATVRRSVADVMLNSASLLSVSRETSLPGLDLIPANMEMGKAERFLPIRANYASILRHALGEELYYDYVLIDCPPSLGAVTTNALTAADLLVVPTQAEYFSSHALRNMMALVRRVREEGNPALTYRILITMLDLRNRIHRLIRDQLRSSFKEGLFDTVIQIDTKLRESSVVGLPITHFVSGTRSAQQYRDLALEIAKNVRQSVPQPA